MTCGSLSFASLNWEEIQNTLSVLTVSEEAMKYKAKSLIIITFGLWSSISLLVFGHKLAAPITYSIPCRHKSRLRSQPEPIGMLPPAMNSTLQIVQSTLSF